MCGLFQRPSLRTVRDATSDQGVGAVPCAGAEVVLVERVAVSVDRGALDEDDPDDEVVGDGEADCEPPPPVGVAVGGEFSVVVVAGLDGAAGDPSWWEDTLASSPMVVVPDEWELPTSADTGFCPMNSTPVTMPMATTKTATA
jgi:hypothetical protein